MPRCKICKDKFNQRFFLQKTCEKPECILEWNKKVREKAWRKEKKKRKENLKSRSDHLKEAQDVFNKFIRLRDKGHVCISCQKPPKKKNAGHYKSVGTYPELRFEELNVHLQCEHCNRFLHGNVIDYRKNLIDKIGLEKVEWLEGSHETKKYTIDEIKQIKSRYKRKIKELKALDY